MKGRWREARSGWCAWCSLPATEGLRHNRSEEAAAPRCLGERADSGGAADLRLSPSNSSGKVSDQMLNQSRQMSRLLVASSRWRYLPWCRSSPTLARDTTASLSRGALALAKAVACGDGFIVVVIEHGGLWAVGLGSESQLGLGKDAHQLLPVRMGGGLTRPSPWWRLDSDTQPQFRLEHFTLYT